MENSKSDIGGVVKSLFEDRKTLPDAKKPQLHDLLSERGYIYEALGAGIYSRRQGTATDILIEVDLNSGRDGYSYLRLDGDAQMQAFKDAQGNTPITGTQTALLAGAVAAPVAGTLYALNDLPYSMPVGIASFAAFIIGLRVLSGAILRNNYTAARERFQQFSPVTEQREAIAMALGSYGNQ